MYLSLVEYQKEKIISFCYIAQLKLLSLRNPKSHYYEKDPLVDNCVFFYS
jgi:hypothetical protein